MDMPTVVQPNSTQVPAPAKTKKTAPTKTTLNLVVREKSQLAPSRVIPPVIVILLLAALFGKFAVADRFNRLLDAERDLAAQETRLMELELSYADYDQVKEQYNQYTYSGFDRTIADRQDILDLLERDVFPYSQTQNVSVTGNVFSTTLTGLTLEQVSSMMAKLEANPIVEGVTVFTAGYDDEHPASQPYATMTIVFTNADEEGGAQ